MYDVLLLQVGDQVIKVIQRLARNEELGVVVDEVGTVVFDIQVLPGFSWILDSLALFLVVSSGTVGTVSTITGGFVALLALGFALVMCLLVDKIFPIGEVSLDLLFRRYSALHPRVGIDLINLWPLGWIQSHHLLEEVLELRRVNILTILSLGVSLPEEFGTTSGNQAVVRVLWVG